ncbi:MAG: twin-arginine translocase subunit TatC, partial [Mariprofundus sp.]|nr:twin-arginine translocase subunit TatC [Mariprofundus sp.]
MSQSDIPSDKPSEEESSTVGVSVLAHLAELRRRATIAIIVYAIGVMVLMNFSELVFEFISMPIRDALPPDTPLIFLNAPDVF